MKTAGGLCEICVRPSSILICLDSKVKVFPGLCCAASGNSEERSVSKEFSLSALGSSPLWRVELFTDITTVFEVFRAKNYFRSGEVFYYIKLILAMET